VEAQVFWIGADWCAKWSW